MSKEASIAMLVLGVVFIVYGVSASRSFSSGISRLFTGSPTDRTIWLLGGGVILAIVGGFGLLRG